LQLVQKTTYFVNDKITTLSTSSIQTLEKCSYNSQSNNGSLRSRSHQHRSNI